MEPVTSKDLSSPIRYELVQRRDGDPDMRTNARGPWVMHSDHARIVERQQQELDGIEKAFREAGYLGNDLAAGVSNLRALFDAARAAHEPRATPVAWRKTLEPQYDYSDRYRYREDTGIGAPDGWEPLYAAPPASSQPPLLVLQQLIDSDWRLRVERRDGALAMGPYVASIETDPVINKTTGHCHSGRTLTDALSALEQYVATSTKCGDAP